MQRIVSILSSTLAFAATASSCLAQGPPAATFVTSRMFAVATNSPNDQAYGIASGDFNNDGKTDIIAAGWSSQVTVNLGNGDGTFQSLTHVYAVPGARAVAVGDFNQDGNLDAAVLAIGNPGSVAIFLGDGTGNLTGPAYYAVGNQGPGTFYNIAVAKLHGGGKLDLVVTNGSDNTVSVLLGNGDGTFQPQVAYSTSGSYPQGNSPQWVAVADVNKDGRLDLVTADSGQGISVLLGNGDGTFQAPVFYSDVLNGSGVGVQANGVAIADLNGDGNLDVVTAAQVGYVNVFLGNGDGTFQPAAGYSVPYATTIAIADLNGDGKPDLVVADFVESTTWVLLNNGGGTFKPGVAYATDNGDQGLILADFNHDGRLDFAVGSTLGPFMTVALGNGDGTFRAGSNYGFVEGYGVDWIVSADLRHNGKFDIVEADPNGRSLHVMLDNSHGVLGAPSTIPICGVPWYVAAGDLNGDGKPDLVAIAGNDSGCGVPENAVAVLLGNGDGTFQAPVYYSIGNSNANNSGNGAAVALAALTSSRKLDIVVSSADGSLSILLNTGSGAFGAASLISGVTAGAEYIVSADFNKDGKLDLALPDYSNNTVKILLGNGNGTFQAPASVAGVPASPSGIAVGDFNRDGKPDLAVTTASIEGGGGGAAIFLGNGDGTFAPGAQYSWDPGVLGQGNPGTSPGAPAAADVNGDGHLDLLIPLGNVHYWAWSCCGIEAGNLGMMVLLGNGDGTFVEDTAGPFIVGYDSLEVVAADFNGDGAMDAAVLERAGNGNYGAAPFVTVLINNTPAVSVSPLTLRFPGQKAGSSSKPQTVVVTNDQATALTISGVSLGGADPGDFSYKSACRPSLPAGAGCRISVTFKPTTTGPRTASLLISDSVGTQTVALSGTGQ